MAKNLPAMQETQVQTLGQEDPLEKGVATHSSILAWRIAWTWALVCFGSGGEQKIAKEQGGPERLSKQSWGAGGQK